MLRRALRLLLALLFALASGAGSARDDAQAEESTADPAAVVARFQSELLSVMKEAEALGYQGRFEHLAPAVRESHDLAAIAQIAVGRYWDDLSEEQRTELVDTFSRLSIATYADRFDGYSGETFETKSSNELSPDVASVHTIFRRPGKQEIRFDYILYKSDDRFRIVNIVVDGVSDLALKRAEYAGILDDDGFDALISQLQEKIAAHSEPAG